LKSIKSDFVSLPEKELDTVSKNVSTRKNNKTYNILNVVVTIKAYT